MQEDKGLTLAQYMREIQLMKRQFGQEEELYPLINMLLREGEKTKTLSIRAVENGSKSKKVIGRNQISAFGIFPDIAILDENFMSITIKFGIPRDVLCKLQSEVEGIRYYLEHSRRKNAARIKVDDNLKTQIIKYCEDANMDKIYGCVEAKPLETKLQEFKETELENLQMKNEKLMPKEQILVELLWYGKVLYTNGLQWQYIKLELPEDQTLKKLREYLLEGKLPEKVKAFNGQIKISSKSIADLTEIFEKIEKGESINDKDKNKWNNFKKELAIIEWKDNGQVK